VRYRLIALLAAIVVTPALAQISMQPMPRPVVLPPAATAQQDPDAARKVQTLEDAQAQIAKYRSNPPIDMGAAHSRGRYIVQATCTQCHNNALQGWVNFTPDLDIAGTYSKAELMHLLEAGEGKKPKLGMMRTIARDHFSQMTPGEREAVVDYILARAHRPQQSQ
jgi:mono/diheme cytochrome c family protein